MEYINEMLQISEIAQENYIEHRIMEKNKSRKNNKSFLENKIEMDWTYTAERSNHHSQTVTLYQPIRKRQTGRDCERVKMKNALI